MQFMRLLTEKFWTELAKCNQAEFLKSGTDGKCIEARELIIALPESFVDYEPKALLELFTEHMKQNYGTECIAALHHNKRKTNYHIHLIFSERKLLEEPIEKIATRNMFYDETGKHVRTKKEILGEDGQIRKGCKVIAKGEVYERNLFTTKDVRFKNEGFLDEVKRSYTDLINLYVKNDKQKLKVFDRNGVYLPMKKIGKNNPKAEQIIADNKVRTKWNLTVDSALVAGISEAKIKEVKRTQISQPASQSIKQNGRNPELFSQLIKLAVGTLEMLIRRIFDMVSAREKEVSKAGASVTEKGTKTVAGQKVSETKTEVVKPEHETGKKVEKQAPERPKQSVLASKYLRLQDVHEKLVKQSRAIQSKKIDIEELEEEKSKLKGFLQGRKRKDVEEKIGKAEKQLANIERGITAIVKPYGYKNVQEFMSDYKVSKTEYDAYQQALEKYEKGVYGKPTASIKERLERYEKEVKERENSRQYTPVRPKDRGADKEKVMEKHIVGENGISYTLGADGFYYPDLTLPKGTDYQIGRYGRMRAEYIKKHHHSMYLELLFTGQWNEYLHGVDEECYEKLELLMEQMKAGTGVTEKLKETDQMKWVGLMNNLKACAEEIVINELIFIKLSHE